ncbi:MAG TPA: hypothetical protein VGE07_04985 [Herpetosiphonaceae bacterium]
MGRTVLGCQVSTAIWQQWRRQLVAPAAPFFLAAEAAGELPSRILRFTRDEFHAMGFPPALRDSYTLWAIAPAATTVALLAPAEFRALAPATQTLLLASQWQLGRGQIYDAAALRDAIGAAAWRDLPPEAHILTPDGPKVALDHAIWHALTPAVQWRWLRWWISCDRPACLAPTLPAPQRAALSHAHPPIFDTLVSSFAATSGANCFATTLAAATPDHAAAQTIADLWLWPGPFLRGLADRGYQADPTIDDPAAAPPGAAVVWVDATETPQHSCYVAGAGLVLNKDSQTWYTPRQLVPLDTVCADWADEAYQRRIYLPPQTGPRR